MKLLCRTLPFIFVTSLALMGCALGSSEILDSRVLVDPEGDDYGPGTYRYPESEVYRSGALDLSEVRLSRQGEMLLVEVVFHKPLAVARGVRLAREQVADLFIATVDIYLDLDGVPGSGRQEALPGRQARLEGASGWELAVVLSPLPSRLKAALEAFVDEGALLVPMRVQTRRHSLRAKVPIAHLGGRSLDSIGVAATVSGTVFGTTFRTDVDGMLPNAFAREVTAQLGRCQAWEEGLDGAPCTFGGCGECQGHPRLIDVLASEPGVQEKALSLWLTEGPGGAQIPISWSEKVVPQERDLRSHLEEKSARVVDHQGDLVTLSLTSSLLPPLGTLLSGYDAAGVRVATLVMTKSLLNDKSGLVLAEIVNGNGGEVHLVRWE